MKELIIIEGKIDSKLKNCYDCSHCKKALNFWCTNDDATKKYLTRLPGRLYCQQWKPTRTLSELVKSFSFFERISYKLFGLNKSKYAKIDLTKPIKNQLYW